MFLSSDETVGPNPICKSDIYIRSILASHEASKGDRSLSFQRRHFIGAMTFVDLQDFFSTNAKSYQDA